MKHLIRQPLLHFFVLGALLFVLFDVINVDSGEAPGEIVVDANRVAALVARFERTWQRPPTQAELDGLIDSYVREEILYREALALGLDQDDPVVRQRMAQKIEFMFDGELPLPDEAELVEWLEAHADQYRASPKYAFEQVFFNPERHGDRLKETVQSALAALDAGDGTVTGDSTLLPGRLELSGALTIERLFGPDFVIGLEDLRVGTWAGPVRSAYGLHLVRIAEHEPGYLPPLDEVRAAVERDWLQAKSEQAKQAFYQVLRDRYDVRIDPELQVVSSTAQD